MWQPCRVLKELRGNRGGVSKQILIKAARHSGHKARVFLRIYSLFFFSFVQILCFIFAWALVCHTLITLANNTPKLFFLSCYRYEQSFYSGGLLTFQRAVQTHVRKYSHAYTVHCAILVWMVWQWLSGKRSGNLSDVMREICSRRHVSTVIFPDQLFRYFSSVLAQLNRIEVK